MNGPYAIDELRALLQRADLDQGARDKTTRYICALIAELAYHHIPQWEIDENGRAKVIPCEAYRTLHSRGAATNVVAVLNDLDFVRAFVVEDRGVIAVGAPLGDWLFVGVRGTLFLYDWKINARVKPLPVNRHLAGSGFVHSGFAEEALRISLKIKDAIVANGLEERSMLVTGHSLGGAVAALIPLWRNAVCIFGSPRYASLAAYGEYPMPLHVRRPSDRVPSLPSRRLGYVDHPYDFKTDGLPFIGTPRHRLTTGGRSWARFVSRKFTDHRMEIYRNELGKAVGASGVGLQLTDYDRLTSH